ncbi:MAG: NADH-quinone oxidoreductase subunit J [Planctomycetes bacterium]|nr:NADH-quinone oxidoreductase subunit J [Planctomycetota bacterium]
MLSEIIHHVIFYGLVLLVLNSAFIVAFSRNITHSAFALLLTFFGVAGLYVFLAADFLAALQLLIYVGGILVLILFAVMLTNKISDVNLSNPAAKPWLGGLISLSVLAVLIWVIVKTPWETVPLQDTPTTAQIGMSIMGQYLLPFEAVSVVLLVALIGAAYLARSEKK